MTGSCLYANCVIDDFYVLYLCSTAIDTNIFSCHNFAVLYITRFKNSDVRQKIYIEKSKMNNECAVTELLVLYVNYPHSVSNLSLLRTLYNPRFSATL